MLLWHMQLRRDQIDDCSCEFPSVHPYRHVGQHGVAGSRFVYLMANDRGKNLPYQDVVKVCRCSIPMVSSSQQCWSPVWLVI